MKTNAFRELFIQESGFRSEMGYLFTTDREILYMLRISVLVDLVFKPFV